MKCKRYDSHEDLIHALVNALHELRSVNANEFVIKQCEKAIEMATGKTYQQRVTEERVKQAEVK